MNRFKRVLSTLIALAMLLTMASMLAYAKTEQDDVQAAHTHAAVYVQSVPATCTTSGAYGYYTCTVAGCEYRNRYYEDEALTKEMYKIVIDPLGHNSGKPVEENHSYIGCTIECDDVIYCTRCEVELNRSRRIISGAHSFGEVQVVIIPTCTTAGKTRQVCTACGKVEEREIFLTHIYVNGLCQYCGLPQNAELTTDANLKFKNLSLTLESDITMTFTVLDSVLEGWSNPYVVFSKPVYNAAGEVISQVERTVSQYTYNAETHLYSFRFPGVNAMEMSNDVTATLYAKRNDNGRLYKGQTVSRSVRTYATNQLGKTTDPKFRTLLVDMLNYGAAAQTYFGYNTADLATSTLNATQKSYGTAGIPTLEKHTNVQTNTGATVKFKSGSLTLREKVEMNITLNLDSYTGTVDALEARITYIDTNNASRTRVIDGSEFVYSTSAQRYVINFSHLNALQMRTPCTIEVFNKQSGTRISDTLTYSIESYAQSKGQSNATDQLLAELVRCMMKYGDAARSYFIN